MTTNRSKWYWLLTIIILAVIITIGSLVIWLKYDPGHPVEISLPPAPNFTGTIYLGGAVTNPGLYPFTAADSIAALFQTAGGTTNSANLSALKLSITPAGDTGPQKIDINRAETWLLKALPGIGDTLAQNIVDYRGQNGPFSSTVELLKVPGIGTKAYDQIKNMITVGD